MPNERFNTIGEYFDAINEILRTATPIGAYCLGFTGVLAKHGFFPAKGVLEQFAACKTVEEGEKLFEAQTIASYEGSDADR